MEIHGQVEPLALDDVMELFAHVHVDGEHEDGEVLLVETPETSEVRVAPDGPGARQEDVVDALNTQFPWTNERKM